MNMLVDLTKINNTIEITQDTELFGLFIGQNNDQVQSELTILHKKPNLTSLTYIKAILFDASSFDCSAKLKIDKGAKQTDAYLKIDVLVMSDIAHARAVPSLEITEDAVKGGHGATIGQVDKEQLFYLKSRGVSEAQAESILISGFLQDFFAKIKDEKILQTFKNEQKRFSNIFPTS